MEVLIPILTICWILFCLYVLGLLVTFLKKGITALDIYLDEKK